MKCDVISVACGDELVRPLDTCECHEYAAVRKRGRPAIHLDNQRVQAFLLGFATYRELADHHPRMDDLFTGASWLQTQGEAHQRPLRRATLFYGLQATPIISAVALADLGRKSRSTLGRYLCAMRVISKQTAILLDRDPRWEVGYAD